jgi:hypothetical protein
MIFSNCYYCYQCSINDDFSGATNDDEEYCNTETAPCFILPSNLINKKPLTGMIDVLHPSFLSLIYPNTKMELIAEDSIWTEGPLWVEDENSSLWFFCILTQN